MTIFVPLSNLPALVAELSIALAVGAGIGAAHYFLLWRNVQILLSGGSMGRALLLHLGRFLATGAALFVIVRGGALPLGVAALGIMSSRIVMGRRIGGGQ